MAHFPVDHRLRGLYRAIALLIGVALAVLGVVGFYKTRDLALFSHDHERVFGVTVNPVLSVALLVLGVVVFCAALIGRNIDFRVNLGIGGLFVLAGLVFICLVPSTINIVAASITNVNVFFVVGILLVAAGLYGKVSDGRAG